MFCNLDDQYGFGRVGRLMAGDEVRDQRFELIFILIAEEVLLGSESVAQRIAAGGCEAFCGSRSGAAGAVGAVCSKLCW